MKNNKEQADVSSSRWAKYLAAGTAGVAAAMGPQATVDADLTVVDVNQTLEDRTQGDGFFDQFGPYTFGGSGASFVFGQAFNELGAGQGSIVLFVNGNIGVAGSVNPYSYVGNLAYGAVLNDLTSFDIVPGANQRGDLIFGSGYPGSNFRDPGTSYVGFTFDIGNGTQYGWAELDLAGAPVNTGTFVRYAYGDPGHTVLVGVVPVPEPNSLGVLALGSLGIAAWRRRRSKTA